LTTTKNDFEFFVCCAISTQQVCLTR